MAVIIRCTHLSVLMVNGGKSWFRQVCQMYKIKKYHKCASVSGNADMHVPCEHLGWYTLGDIIIAGTKYLSSPNAPWSSAGLNNFACLQEAGEKSASFLGQNVLNFQMWHCSCKRSPLQYRNEPVKPRVHQFAHCSFNMCPTHARKEVCPHLTSRRLSSSVQPLRLGLVQNCSIDGLQISSLLRTALFP